MRKLKNWGLAFLLTLPMLFFYGRYYFRHDAALHPTGFIAYDNVSYVAYGKEYLDAGQLHVLYQNPMNDSGSYPGIYFQTQTFLYALLLSCKIPPGLIIVLFNWIGTLLSFRVAIALYDHVMPGRKYRSLFLGFFCWGGGLLAIAGIPVAMSRSIGNLDFFDRMFYLDPGWGWWGLNFGRGHFISSEGYFHFLFMCGVLCMLKKKWAWALLAALFISFSHPFTGLEFLAIAGAWCFSEKFLFRNKDLPFYFIAGISIILCLHLFYYLYYLNSFPEHRSVSEQYALNWRLRFFHMIPAWCLVGSLAAFSCWKFKNYVRSEPGRLFCCWFLVAVLLANHELFMKPMQPIHFTRGYIWTSLFLLGLPSLHFIFESSLKKKNMLAPVAMSLLLLSDNFLWLANYIRSSGKTVSVSYITDEQRQILKSIQEHSNNATLVIGSDPVIPYLSTVYTKAYPWISHPYTTPFAERKKEAYRHFILEQSIDSAWVNRDLIFIFRKDDPEEFSRAQSLAFPVQVLADTKSYLVEKARIKK